ncbi:GNAT family N-acetyltransferase [Amycolatopsis saalfeldensis]|uniref:Diamine N-acetyltransferase n=1 Tax=Amycolatopsis saalfeldensis TaxID=394193 RepID=A0A1H8XJ00_9PSEU|nr:GNAT family N-acetyltransferase [Amycolatopsis saalfeldensis]SEP39258.1 diamine N-acetyltransferase [Amycolatopsis saalfeldensis]
MDTPHLAEVTADNVNAACRLAVAPHQRDYVASVAESLAEAYVQPAVAWPRLIYAGGELVGFVMGAFDPNCPIDYFRHGIWRLNIADGHQGKGYGRFAVESVLAEARHRGAAAATVLWKPGDHSPEPFYLKLGFRPTGQVHQGETVGRLPLET